GARARRTLRGGGRGAPPAGGGPRVRPAPRRARGAVPAAGARHRRGRDRRGGAARARGGRGTAPHQRVPRSGERAV
ncbi:MAG: hypothetical protein AVDCRST_MAG11-3048, partial [uncultured Gemmatimonadaceae bacterium]